MKNIVTVFIAAVFVAGFYGCGKDDGGDKGSGTAAYQEWTYVKEYIVYPSSGQDQDEYRWTYTYDREWRVSGYKWYYWGQLLNEESDYEYSDKSLVYKKTSYWGAEPEYSLSEKVYADSDLKYPLVIKYYVGMDSDQAPSHRIVYTYDSEMRETSVKYYFEEVLDSENRNYIYSDKRLTYDYVEYEGEIEKPQLVDITYADDYYKYPVRVSQLDYDTKEENQYDAYEYDAQWRVVKRTTGGKYFEEGDRDYVKIVEENYAYKNKVCTFDDNYYDADGMIVSTRKKVIYYY